MDPRGYLVAPTTGARWPRLEALAEATVEPPIDPATGRRGATRTARLHPLVRSQHPGDDGAWVRRRHARCLRSTLLPGRRLGGITGLRRCRCSAPWWRPRGRRRPARRLGHGAGGSARTGSSGLGAPIVRRRASTSGSTRSAWPLLVRRGRCSACDRGHGSAADHPSRCPAAARRLRGAVRGAARHSCCGGLLRPCVLGRPPSLVPAAGDDRRSSRGRQASRSCGREPSARARSSAVVPLRRRGLGTVGRRGRARLRRSAREGLVTRLGDAAAYDGGRGDRLRRAARRGVLAVAVVVARRRGERRRGHPLCVAARRRWSCRAAVACRRRSAFVPGLVRRRRRARRGRAGCGAVGRRERSLARDSPSPRPVPARCWRDPVRVGGARPAVGRALRRSRRPRSSCRSSPSAAPSALARRRRRRLGRSPVARRWPRRSRSSRWPGVRGRRAVRAVEAGSSSGAWRRGRRRRARRAGRRSVLRAGRRGALDRRLADAATTTTARPWRRTARLRRIEAAAVRRGRAGDRPPRPMRSIPDGWRAGRPSAVDRPGR